MQGCEGMTKEFKGQQATALDAKGRLAFPARYRDLLLSSCEGKLVITVNPDKSSLLIYPQPAYEQRAAVISKMSDFVPSERRLKLMFVGHAFDLEMDDNFRVLVPQTLRSLVGIERDVVVVGQQHKLELWDAARWMQQVEVMFGDGPEGVVSDKLVELSL
jgi:MraZ protein